MTSKTSPSRTACSAFLRNASEEELRAALRELCASLPEVRAYFAARSGKANAAALLATAKDAVTREFYPSRGLGRARPAVPRKVIASFCSTVPDIEMHVELLLHHALVGVTFIQDFGGVNEALLSSLEASFRRGLALLVSPALRQRFQPTCESIVAASDGIGWGFHDALADLYTFAFRSAHR